MFIIAILVLGCLVEQGYAVCSPDEERIFVNENLGLDCRAKLSLLDFKNSAIRMDQNELNSICTSSCLGRYSSWLSKTCNNTAKAWFQRAACLRQQDSQERKQCRFFFPDFTNISSPKQCGVLLPDKTASCTGECRDPLQELITRLGCCFETIYDNKLVTEGLQQQGFLTNEEFSALKLFQSSDILSRCIEIKPVACIGEAFSFSGGDTSGAGGSRSSRLFVVHMTVMTLVLIFFTSFI